MVTYDYRIAVSDVSDGINVDFKHISYSKARGKAQTTSGKRSYHITFIHFVSIRIPSLLDLIVLYVAL